MRDRKSAAGREGLVQGLMQEFSLSSQEGVALMCLAEALLRIPDTATADALIRDKIGTRRLARASRPQPVAVRQRRDLGPADHRQAGRRRTSEKGLASGADPPDRARAASRVIRKGVDLAMRLLGEQFVTGETIEEALEERARRARRTATATPTTCWARRR